MTAVAVILGVLLMVTAGYLLLILRQLRAVSRQLEQHVDDGDRSAVTVALVVPQLETLVARVNETVRAAQAASTRTRQEERRIRSFIADISHDLRTPLTTVQGYLQLLDRTELEAMQRERVRIATRHAQELGTLVDRLYEYAYLLEVEPRVEPEQVDVGVLVAECLLGMTGEIEAAGLDVHFDPPTPSMLLTDREILTRVVQNLARNAVRHGVGTLEVAVSQHSSSDATSAAAGDPGVEPPGTAAGGRVTVGLTNGLLPGAEVDADRLFDRFYTADRSRSARTSGLGLSIVQVLVQQLGGTADASVDEDRLTVQVSLPGLGRE